MSCHLWNINKKFVSILKIKINDLEGHAPKGTFKIYLDILIAIRKKKNKQTRKLLILKRNIGKKLKTEPYWKWVIWFTSQQRDLDRIRFTTLCCKLFLFLFFFPEYLFILRYLKALKLIPSHPPFCYQIEKQVLSPHEAMLRAWCSVIWRIPHVTYPSLPHI